MTKLTSLMSSVSPSDTLTASQSRQFVSLPKCPYPDVIPKFQWLLCPFSAASWFFLCHQAVGHHPPGPFLPCKALRPVCSAVPPSTEAKHGCPVGSLTRGRHPALALGGWMPLGQLLSRLSGPQHPYSKSSQCED